MQPQKQVNFFNATYNWGDKIILLIDNDEINSKIISFFFRSISCRLICRTDPIEGLNYLKEQPVDLVLTELYFKKLRGINLIRQIRKINGSIPIIAQSSLIYVYENEKETYLKAGCAFYFTKPTDFKKLMRTIDICLKPSLPN